jgi:hypothetical protein
MLRFITRVGSSFKHGASGLTSNKWENLAQQVYLRDYADEEGFFAVFKMNVKNGSVPESAPPFEQSYTLITVNTHFVWISSTVVIASLLNYISDYVLSADYTHESSFRSNWYPPEMSVFQTLTNVQYTLVLVKEDSGRRHKIFDCLF